jgi:hypothetical protein
MITQTTRLSNIDDDLLGLAGSVLLLLLLQLL